MREAADLAHDGRQGRRNDRLVERRQQQNAAQGKEYDQTVAWSWLGRRARLRSFLHVGSRIGVRDASRGPTFKPMSAQSVPRQ
jgi:hypothetical protein